jgi:iron complex outermembrane recepter protein
METEVDTMREFSTVLQVFAMAMVLANGPVHPVGAQQPAGDARKVVMGEVVVTASRQAEEATRVPAHVTVISAEEIERSTAQNVPEVLGSLGIHVNDVTGNNRSYSVDLRGFGENAPANLLVMVDGRRINQPDLSGTDWMLIPLERIERIEVIRGPRGSVLYGDNATGGVINIITKEGAIPEGRAALHYGKYDTFRGAAGVGGIAGVLSYDITGSYLKSDGYRDNSDTEARDVGATFRIDPGDAVRLNLSTGYHKDETGMPGALRQSDLDAGRNRTESKNPDDFADTEDYYVKAGGEFFFLTDDAFRLDATYRKRSVSQFSSFSGGLTFRGDTEIDTITVSPQLMFQEQFGEVSNRLIIGADYTRAEADINDSFGQVSGLKKENRGYYVHDDLGVTQRLTLSGGYRYDRSTFDLSTSGFDFMGLPFSDQAKSTFAEEAYTLGANYRVGRSKFYVSYGTSFRYPLLDEFFNYADFQFNPNLKAQTSRNWETGAEYQLTDNLVLMANLFHLKTKNEIFLDPQLYANINLDGETTRQGIETRVGYRRGGLSSGAGYTYTHARIKNGTYDGAEVPDVPERQAYAHVSYRFDFGLLVGLNGIYVGKRPFIGDFENAFPQQKAYTVINAKIEYAWRWVMFFVNFNNINNETYSAYGVLGSFPDERAYYPSPEFNFLAGVKARFGGR